MSKYWKTPRGCLTWKQNHLLADFFRRSCYYLWSPASTPIHARYWDRNDSGLVKYQPVLVRIYAWVRF